MAMSQLTANLAASDTDVLTAQLKVQEDSAATKRAEVGNDRSAGRAAKYSLFNEIRADSAAAKLPKIPIISKKSGWLKLWNVVQHYLTKDKYLFSLYGTIANVAEKTKSNNAKQSAAPDDLLIGAIQDDAISMFWNTGDE